MRISIFDLDRTLTHRPTYSLFLLKSAWKQAPWRLVLIPLLLPYAIAYLLKILPRKRMKERMHALALGPELNRAQVDDIVESFAREVSATGIYSEGIAQLQKEKQLGRRIILATAAPSFYARPIARHLGVTDVVATRGTWQHGCLKPEIRGKNCHGTEKRRKLAHFLKRMGIQRANAHIRFFSDDLSDLPTFEWCDEAIAVNPGTGLDAIARQRRWKVLDWRRPSGFAT